MKSNEELLEGNPVLVPEDDLYLRAAANLPFILRKRTYTLVDHLFLTSFMFEKLSKDNAQTVMLYLLKSLKPDQMENFRDLLRDTYITQKIDEAPRLRPRRV